MRYSIIFILAYFCLSACNQQVNKDTATNNKTTNPKNVSNIKEADDGIIYLSADNGTTWKSASSGLPQEISIGLGGIAVSETLLGVATKEYGVYFYNFKDSNWVSVPTAQEIIAGNIGALALFNHAIYVGTQHKGIFYSIDNGKNKFEIL